MEAYLHKDADKYLNRLNAKDRERLNDAIDKLEKEPPEGDVEPITGQQGNFRTRVGSYRILWRIKDNSILVTHIEPRGQAYTKKTKSNRGKK